MTKKLEAKKHTTAHYARRLAFSGVWLTAALIILQILIIFDLFVKVGKYSPYVVELLMVINAVVVIYIINDKSNPAYKIAWIIPVMLMPLLGGVFYLFVRLNFGALAPKRVLNNIIKKTQKYAGTSEEIQNKVRGEETDFFRISSYLEKTGGYPTWSHTGMTYYPLGDDTVEVLVEELKKAKEFIFLEYFIIEEGLFWNQILEVLEEKAGAGLDVRVMYDDFGCLAMLPRQYHVLLKKKGILARKYATLRPFLSTHLNNRDHRKMIIIDGETAFSGGINLADCYINAYEKYGHWKDNGFLIRGAAVHNYTLMFLQMWNISSVSGKDDYVKYLKPGPLYRAENKTGYVIAYGDGPHQEESVAKNVYLDVISRSRRYVYIMTPYLILDHRLQQVLEHTAKCGVDVRIIMPRIPDKKIVFYIGRTHYPQLIRAGVRVYEYLPGFVHSKTFLSDDDMAIVGTVNLDFRSFYLHYECAALFYKTEGLKQIKEDFTETFKQCKEMTLGEYYKTPIWQRIIGRILRVLGPLM